MINIRNNIQRIVLYITWVDFKKHVVLKNKEYDICMLYKGLCVKAKICAF